MVRPGRLEEEEEEEEGGEFEEKEKLNCCSGATGSFRRELLG